MKYTARSASYKTEDWPYWMIANESGLNVTVHLIPILRGKMPFVTRALAEAVAEKANENPDFIYKPRIRLTNAMIEEMKEKRK